jgi:hypothetical protein
VPKRPAGSFRLANVDPENLLFVREGICNVREAAPKTYQTIKTLDDKCAEVYSGHPLYRPPDLVQMVRRAGLEPCSAVRACEASRCLRYKLQDSIRMTRSLSAPFTR